MSTVREVRVWTDEASFIADGARSDTTLLPLCSPSRVSIPSETRYQLRVLERFRIDRSLHAAEMEGVASVITGRSNRPEMRLGVVTE